MTSDPLESLIARYRAAAVRHGEGKSPRTVNKAADEIASVYRELRALGADAVARLLPLFDDPSASVRCWAAAHTLDYVPERATNVLEAMAVEGPTPAIRIDAEMTLRMWRAGRLRFP